GDRSGLCKQPVPCSAGVQRRDTVQFLMKGNIMEKVLCLYILLLCGGMCMSCGEDFLNVKSDMSIAAPGKISDYQALLDNTTALMNITAANSFALIAGEEYRV